MRYIVRKCDDGDTVSRSGKLCPRSWDVVAIDNDGAERVVANLNTRAAARAERAAQLRQKEQQP